jgi:hypothetical protein
MTTQMPTPAEWVEELRRREGLTEYGLAKALMLDKKQVEAWLDESEPVPLDHLATLALTFAPADYDFVMSAAECDDVRRRMRSHVRVLERKLGLPEGSVWSPLTDHVDRLVESHEPRTRMDRARLHSRFLAEAAFAVRMISKMHAEGTVAKLVNPSNISFHLRYPANHFVGLLLDLGSRIATGDLSELRSDALTAIRKLAAGEKEGSSVQALVGQHSLHMLGRYGDVKDRQLVQEMVDVRRTADPMARRLGYTALILVTGERSLTDDFLEAFCRDTHLSNASIDFDRLHYGDTDLSNGGTVPKGRTCYRNAVGQMLKHIEDSRYANIRSLEVAKLNRVLERAGPPAFVEAGMAHRIGSALNIVEGLPDDELGENKRFIRQFSELRDSLTAGSSVIDNVADNCS